MRTRGATAVSAALLFVSLSSATSVAAELPTPVAYWPFNSSETLTDGNLSAGSVVARGAAQFTTNGKFGGGLELNGTDSWLDGGSSLTGIALGNANYTLSAWIKVGRSDCSTAQDGIIGWGTYWANNRVNALRLRGEGFRHYWWANDLDAVESSVCNGAWHHVAATFDGTTRTLYYDGASLVTDTPGSSHDVTAQNFGIGKTYNDEYFDGILDEVAIWDQALSTSEIQRLASGGAIQPDGSSSTIDLDQVPPPVFQEIGRSAEDACDAFTDPSLDWSGVSSGGWHGSWRQWPNGGAGGYVCARQLAYDPVDRRWRVN